MRKSACRLLAVLVVLGLTSAAQAQQKSSPQVLGAFRAVVARPSESTVRVRRGDKDVALGTIVGADGWVLTKASELKGAAGITCRIKDGREVKAKVVGVEDRTDLAMLKIEASGLKPIEWRASKSAEVGDWIVSPGAGADPVAVGVVSVAARKVQARDMPPSPLPPNAGYLGVGLETAEGGAKIGMITPRSPAARAGLQVGDLVVKASGKAVKDHSSLVQIIQSFQAKQTITLVIKRGSEEKRYEVTLARRPRDLDRSAMQNSMGSTLSERRNGFPMILQHDQVLKPTDCGGPLVDLDGKAVGVNIARAGRVETYAIPTETVQSLLADLKSGKLAPKATVTVSYEDLESALKKARAELMAVEKAMRDAEGRENAEALKKELTPRLATARKKLDDALQALEKERKDPTKK